MFYSENGEGLSREPQQWILNFTWLSQSELIFDVISYLVHVVFFEMAKG